MGGALNVNGLKILNLKCAVFIREHLVSSQVNSYSSSSKLQGLAAGLAKIDNHEQKPPTPTVLDEYCNAVCRSFWWCAEV